MSHDEEHDPLITSDDENLLDDVLDAVMDYVLIQETNLRGEIVLDATEFRIEKLKAMRGVKDVLDDYIEKQVRRVVADMLQDAAERGTTLESDVEEVHADETEEETIPAQPRRAGMRPAFLRS